MSDEETQILTEAVPALEEPGAKPDKKDKKSKKGKKGKADAPEGLTIAGHPRAGAQVRKAKGWAGLLAFGITAYLSLSAGLTPDQAGLRALAAGIGGYLLGWACSVTVWRQLLIAELRALAEHAQGAPPRMAASPAPAPAPAPSAEPSEPAQ